MVIFFGIILLALSFFLVWIIFNLLEDFDEAIPSSVLGALAIVLFIAGIGIIDEHLYPSIAPIDVYRGKTTIEYKVVDGMKTDSIVIFIDSIYGR